MKHGIFSSSSTSFRRRAAIVLFSLGAACAGAAFAQDKPTELRVLTHSSFALPKPLLAQFEKEAGAKLRISKAGDAGEMLNKLILTRKAPVADVVFGIDNALAAKALAADVLEIIGSPVEKAAFMELKSVITTIMNSVHGETIDLQPFLDKLSEWTKVDYSKTDPNDVLPVWDDIVKLLKLLGRLRDAGATIIIIEHHSDVILAADWVLELGPVGGNKGGELIFAGSPADLLKAKNSPTGKALSAE
jgi:hypothetical protein